MAGLTDDWERIVLDILFGPTVYGEASSGVVPDTYHVGLFSVMPTDSAAGTEIGGDGYARATIPNTPENWEDAVTVGGVTSKVNTFPVTFPTAMDDWAVDPVFAVGYGVYTADFVTGGLLVIANTLSTPKEIPSGDTPSIGAGLIIIRAD